MKLRLDLNGESSQIELLARAPECRFRLDGGTERSADVEAPEPGVYSILLDGHSYEARVEVAPAALIVVVDGHRFEIRVDDPRRWKRGSASAGGRGVETISAPMPGKIVRVLVGAGDTVEAGQGVVVVEAMKMQNEMKAARAGRVATLPAREGAAVSAGEVLATIE